MSEHLRIVLYYRAPDGQPEEIEAGYRKISEILAGTPGLLGNELLRSRPDPAAFAVMSEWESFEAFHAWDTGPDHKGQTSVLRPYQDQSRTPFWEMYSVVASYDYEA